jgi:transcriptional regulator with XRE-family HTH domain
MNAVQKVGKSGPRLTVNRKQQKALLSLLRQLRRDTGLRQKDIAKALGKPQAFVSYYETGARRLDLLELREVCEVLGISLGVFVRKFEKELLDPRYQHFQRQPAPLDRYLADA